MFRNVFNFAYQRNWKEAIGFYLFYVVLMNSLIFFIYLIIQVAFKFEIIDSAKKYLGVIDGFILFINVFSVLFVASIALLIFSKKQLKSIKGFFVLTLVATFTRIGGDILGLIPVAILSMFPNKNISE